MAGRGLRGQFTTPDHSPATRRCTTTCSTCTKRSAASRPAEAAGEPAPPGVRSWRSICSTRCSPRCCARRRSRRRTVRRRTSSWCSTPARSRRRPRRRRGAALPHLQATFEIMRRIHNAAGGARYPGRPAPADAGAGPAATAGRPCSRRPRPTWSRSSLTWAAPNPRLRPRRGGTAALCPFRDGRPPCAGGRPAAILHVSAEHGIPATLLDEDGRPWLIPPPLYDRLVEALRHPAARLRLDAWKRHEVLGRTLRSLPERPRPARPSRSCSKCRPRRRQSVAAAAEHAGCRRSVAKLHGAGG